MNTGVGSLFLLQWIFLTQELNLGFLHCRQILYQLSYQGSPSQWEFSVWLGELKPGLCSNLERWDGVGGCIPVLIHVDIWKKPAQYCKAIILELKIKISRLSLKKNKKIYWKKNLIFLSSKNFCIFRLYDILPVLLWNPVVTDIPLSTIN